MKFLEALFTIWAWLTTRPQSFKDEVIDAFIGVPILLLSALVFWMVCAL